MNAQEWIRAHYQEMLEDFAMLIRIDSVQADPQEQAPFGEKVAKALEFVGTLAEKFGFTFHNVDGYVGYFDFREEGHLPEYGVISHVDVVPPRKGNYPSFELTEAAGKFFGRGTIDDKGPTIILLYVLAALKQTGFSPAHNMRMLVGTNEESGWADIDYIKDRGILPKYGFSPDADYPVINGEKGAVQFELTRCHQSDTVIWAQAGDRPNIVPDRATCLVNLHHEEVTTLCSCMALDVKVEKADQEQTKLTFFGKSAHASMPELGHNAAKEMLRFLGKLDSSFYGVKSLFAGDHGFGLGFVNEALTCNLGAVHYQEGKLTLVGDIRAPREYTVEQVQREIEKSTGIYEINYTHVMPPHFVEENSFLVQTLLKAYEKATGEEGYAFTIGGGTYSRVFEQGVAFGCLFPGEAMVAHQADEYFAIDSFQKNIDIMLEAMTSLLQ